jgi:hypothetical protein
VFSQRTNERLKLFENQLVEVSNTGVEIEEKIESGYAKVKINCDNRIVVFKNMEKKRLQNLKCKNCADYIIFEETEDGITVHILEMKRTVKEKEWEHIKKQFLGAVLNSYALAGVLETEIDERRIQFYTCYRRDLINSSVSMRAALANRTIKSGNAEWNSGMVKIEERGCSVKEFCHHKIQLDEESGFAEYKIEK